MFNSGFLENSKNSLNSHDIKDKSYVKKDSLKVKSDVIFYWDKVASGVKPVDDKRSKEEIERINNEQLKKKYKYKVRRRTC